MASLPALIISGGQQGADQAGLRAAKFAGIPTGGFAPRGWETEAGPAPWLADFGLREHGGGYRARTIANVALLEGDGFGACLWFGKADSPGGKLTLSQCRIKGVENYVVTDWDDVQRVADWIFHVVACGGVSPVTLMIAGNRESSNPGIGDKTVVFCRDFFAILKEMK